MLALRSPSWQAAIARLASPRIVAGAACGHFPCAIIGAERGKSFLSKGNAPSDPVRNPGRRSTGLGDRTDSSQDQACQGCGWQKECLPAPEVVVVSRQEEPRRRALTWRRPPPARMASPRLLQAALPSLAPRQPRLSTLPRRKACNAPSPAASKRHARLVDRPRRPVLHRRQPAWQSLGSEVEPVLCMTSCPQQSGRGAKRGGAVSSMGEEGVRRGDKTHRHGTAYFRLDKHPCDGGGFMRQRDNLLFW